MNKDSFGGRKAFAREVQEWETEGGKKLEGEPERPGGWTSNQYWRTRKGGASCSFIPFHREIKSSINSKSKYGRLFNL